MNEEIFRLQLDHVEDAGDLLNLPKPIAQRGWMLTALGLETGPIIFLVRAQGFVALFEDEIGLHVERVSATACRAGETV